MKKLLLLLMLLIAADGYAQVFVQIGSGTDASTNSLYSPLIRLSGNMGNRYCRSNIVLTQQELTNAGMPPGATITGVAFNKTNVTDYTGYTFYHSLFVANSTISPPLSTSTTWASILASHTQVYVDSNQTMPNSAGWVTFNFNSPVLYTGQNLSIATEQDWTINQSYNAAVATNWELTPGFEDHIVGVIATSIPPNLSGTAATYKRRPNVRVFYTLPTGTDAALLNFASPTTPVFGGTQIPVSLTVANAASTNITSMTINYQLNNGSVITENWTGNIATGTSSIVSFNTLLTTPATSGFNLKAWVSDVNGAGLDLVRQNDSLNSNYCTVLNNPSYTVGGAGADFVNLQAAFNQISCGGISGNVNLTIMQSDTGNFVLNNFPATSGSSLTISGGAPNVTLANAGTSSVLNLVQVNNVNVTNLIFERTAAPVAAQDLLFVSNSSNVNIISNTFNGFAGSTSSSNRLVHLSGVNTATIQANTFTNGYYGIHTTAGTGGNASLSVLNNTITDTYHTPINITGANSNTFVGSNIISNNITVSTSGIGINLAAGTNSTIYGNHISGNLGDYGIYLNNYTGDSLNPNQVINNVIACNLTNAAPNGIRLLASGTGADADYAIIAHNSILIRTASTSTTTNGAIYITGGTVAAPACNGIKIFNNVVQAISTAASGNLPANFRSFYISNEYYLTSVLQSNHNHFDVPNPGNFAAQGTPVLAFATIQDWRTATGRDVNSQTGDPLFTNPSVNNLIPLSSSPLANAGTPLNFVPTDIDGNARSATTPDVGAYEIQSISNSVIAVSIDTPVTILVPNTNQEVKASFLNAGSNTLTSLQLSYKYGNNPTVTENWTGSISSGATLNYTFTTLMAVGSPVGPQQLLVWSALPNGMPDADPTNDTLQASFCLSLPGGTYTVGSPTSDFPVVADLMNSLNCAGISGPVTFNFDFPANLYTAGNLILDNVPGVSATNTITLNGQGDTIRHSALTGERDRPIIGLFSTDFVTIRNFILQTASASFGHGVYLQNANDIKIINNVIDLRNVTATTATQFTGILASATHSGTSATNFNRLVIDSNTIISAGQGVRLAGDANAFSLNLKISNNTIIDFYNNGVFLSNVDSAIIENNEMTRPGRVAVTTFQGVNLEANTQGIVVRNNRIHNSHGSASSITAAAYGVRISGNSAHAKRNQVYNNLIYNFQATGNQNGILLNNADNVDIYYNTISLDDINAASGAARGIYMQAHCRSINLLNNNISVTKGGSGEKQGIYLERDTTIFSSNHNNIYVNAAAGTQAVFHFGTTGYATLAAWQAAASSLYDQNSVSDIPNFANLGMGDLTPQNSTLNNAALPVIGIITDFTGAARGTTPDIGAIEFTPLGTDVSLTNFLTNPGNGCITNLSVPVTIRVSNTGNNAVSNVPVFYKLNSNAIVAETITGSIAGGTSTDYTFSAPMLLRNGLDTLSMWVRLTGDQNATNDSLFFFFNNYQSTILTIPTTFNFENGQLPANLCTTIGDSAAIAVMGNVGPNTPLNGNFSLLMKGSTSGTPWSAPTLTNWWTINPNHLTSVDLYVKADTVQRLQLAFNLRQLYRTAASGNNFRVLINDTERIAVGQTAASFRAANAAASALTVPLVYDLSGDVGDTIKITFQASVRYNELDATPHAVLLDDIVISQPTTIGFDSVTTITNSCLPGPKVISAVLDTLLPINAVTLNYNVNGGADQNISMSRSGAATWTATLPAQAINVTVNYRVIAADNAGNSDTSAFKSFIESPITIDAGADQSINTGSSATLIATSTGLFNANSLLATLNGGNGLSNGAISMNVEALTTVLIDTITTRFYSSASGAVANVSVWYKTTPVTAGPVNVTPPDWVLHASNILVPVVATSNASSSPLSTFTIPALTIPAGSTYSVVVAITGASLGYTTYALANPSIFNDGNIILDNGSTAGFGGGFPTIPNNPRQFNGRLGYRVRGPVSWSVAGNPTIIANSDTLVVTPASTTTYVASGTNNGCTKTDTVIVTVVPLNAPELTVSQIIAPVTGPTSINSPMTISFVVKNIGTQPAVGYTLLATANGTTIASQVETTTLQAGDSVIVNMQQLWNPASDTFTVCVSATNANDPIVSNNELCVNNVVITNTTSVFESDMNNKLIQKAYPNPARETMTVHLSGRTGALQMIVADVTGKVLLKDVIETSNAEVDYVLDVCSLAEGMYHFRIVDASGQQATLRFVVSR